MSAPVQNKNKKNKAASARLQKGQEELEGGPSMACREDRESVRTVAESLGFQRELLANRFQTSATGSRIKCRSCRAHVVTLALDRGRGRCEGKGKACNRVSGQMRLTLVARKTSEDRAVQ